MKKLLLFSAVLIFLTTIELRAQTYISSSILTDTTWTVANSPYIITSDVAVFPNVTLTIDPGVTVEFDDHIVFTVKGILKAIGSINDSIVFTSSSVNPYTSVWDGINLENTPGASAQFGYCKGLYADAFISMLYPGSSDTSLIISHSTFSLNYIVVFNYSYTSSYIAIIDSCLFLHNVLAIVYADHSNISNCTFSNNTKAIYGFDSQENVQVSNCVFTGQTDYNVLLKGTITGCSFINNVYGIHLRYGLTATNNLITGNTYGISSFTSVNITGNPVASNTICNNTYNVYMEDNFNINLANNCWCDSDSAAIEESIYDAYDNGTLGIVTFMPVVTDCGISPTSVPSDFLSGIPVKSFPEPFSDHTTIQFNLIESASISLRVFEMHGRLVKTLLANETMMAGDHSVNFYGNDLPAGIYYYVISNESQHTTGKMVFIK